MSTRYALRHARLLIATATILAASALAIVVWPAAAQAYRPDLQAKLPTMSLTAGIHIIRAEIANTEATRHSGLMHRPSLPDNDGMLFVFDSPDRQCFWMRNTPLPLSIAFIANDGAIVNIADMAPHTDDIHCSTQPVRYALEMAQGWFDRHGVKAGGKIGGLPY